MRIIAIRTEGLKRNDMGQRIDFWEVWRSDGHWLCGQIFLPPTRANTKRHSRFSTEVRAEAAIAKVTA